MTDTSDKKKRRVGEISKLFVVCACGGDVKRWGSHQPS